MNAPRQLGGAFSILVADDHPSVSLAVSQICADLLGIEGTSIATAHSSGELLAVCATPSSSNRIVVLDMVMPGEWKRAALVEVVRRADPSARVVAYSADESPFLATSILNAGAMGYVAKSSPTTELVDAMVAVSHGRQYVDARIDLQALHAHPWTSLTDSERAVLLAVCRGEKASDIVATTGRSYSTVTTHKYNGLNKLGLRHDVDLLPYLYANGLICELDADPSMSA
ncbi:MAG: response regulator [Rhodanobacter sp.]